MLVMTPDVGLDDAASSRDLAAAAHGHLARPATSVSGSSANTVSGTPISLLRLPLVATTRATGAQQRGEDVLGRGLAGAAGDGHDDGAGAAPHGGGEAAERALAVVDHDARRARPQAGRRPGA